MANRIQIQNALQNPYDRILFGKEVLSPVFGSCFTLRNSVIPTSVQPNKSEQDVIQSVSIYGNINLEDGTEITCYEIILQPSVRIEHSKVAIQRYVRKLLTAGQIALVNFIAPQNKNVWRLTLVAKDSELTEQGIVEKSTHAKRYTYLLGPSETCKTAAERFESLSTEKQITFQALVNSFSVEKLSKAFFDEYTLHYQKFCNFLQESNFRKSVFKITIPENSTQEEKDKACKPIRDFVKKLLGRLVFLYFVQKKGWLGASDTDYQDGLTDFIKQLFKQSGGNDTFYSSWLTVLFFETLNKERNNDDFIMPDGKKVKVPFLNGGLFDKEDHDEHILTFNSKLLHNPDFEDALLSAKNKDNSRGFLDFLDSFNFTVHEDSPDDHTVAVDPEMLGHIFENLLEDNKDKGAFYTPKEIVHYMCQESLTEYLTTHLSKEYTVYKEIGNAQIELFGNETKTGQLKMLEELGDKALNRDDVTYIVKHKDISHLTKAQLKKMDSLLDTVKICDPAIGSGAFPMGLLQEIHAIKEVIAYELQQPWKPADVKENIIQNSVYGVDIEKGAVDIARLRFWLSLVVDEEKPRALPNLDYKIVVGDSLVSKFEGEIIEIDWDRKSSVGKGDTFVQNIQQLLKEIADKQKKFFKPDNKDKKKLQAEIRNLKLELLINQLSFNKEKFLASNIEKGGFAPTVKDLRYNEELKQKKNEFDRHIVKLQKLKQNKDEPFEHFDWKLDFPEVLNEIVTNSSQISVANSQILALNLQIDAINNHLEQNEKDIHLIHLQTNIAQSQVTIIKEQLEKIELKITEIYGKLNTIEKDIVSEPDLSFIYTLKSINLSIFELNQKIENLNPQLNSQNPNVGFDIVIGNPPYVQVKWLTEDYNISKFQSFSRSTDLYCLFYELSNILLKENGVGNFITSNKWLRSDYGKKIKEYFINNTENLVVIDFGGYQIFESATVDTNITKWNKNSNTQNSSITISYNTCTKIDELDKLVFSNFFNVKYDSIWTFKNNKVNSIKDKIELKFKRIGETDVVFNYGILTGANPVFIINSAKRDQLISLNKDIDRFIVPILRGKDLQKYWYEFKGYYLLNLHNGVSKKNIKPVILDNKNDKELIDYLNSFGEDFKSRGEKGINWYNLRSCNYIDLYVLPKILYADIVQDSGKFYFDNLGYYTNDTTFMIYSNDTSYLKFLTVILNSKPANFFYINYYCGGSLGNKGIRFKKDFLIQLPVPPYNSKLLKLFNNILTLKQNGNDSTTLEQEIDNLVYKLYDLTLEEVKVIEPEFKLNKKEYDSIELD